MNRTFCLSLVIDVSLSLKPFAQTIRAQSTRALDAAKQQILD